MLVVLLVLVCDEIDWLFECFCVMLCIFEIGMLSWCGGFVVVDVVVLLCDVCELYELLVEVVDVLFEFEVVMVDGIYGDCVLLFEVFSNFVDNVIKFILLGGCVCVVF